MYICLYAWGVELYIYADVCKCVDEYIKVFIYVGKRV